MSGVQIQENAKLGIKSEMPSVVQVQEMVELGIKSQWALKELFKRYCDEKKLVYGSVTFLRDGGDRILPDQSAEQLHLKDGDFIDAMVSVLRGGCAFPDSGL